MTKHQQILRDAYDEDKKCCRFCMTNYKYANPTVWWRHTKLMHKGTYLHKEIQAKLDDIKETTT